MSIKKTTPKLTFCLVLSISYQQVATFVDQNVVWTTAIHTMLKDKLQNLKSSAIVHHFSSMHFHITFLKAFITLSFHPRNHPSITKEKFHPPHKWRSKSLTTTKKCSFEEIQMTDNTTSQSKVWKKEKTAPVKFHPANMAEPEPTVKAESLWQLSSLPTSTMLISQLLFTYFLSAPTVLWFQDCRSKTNVQER